jgi:hypothetical protein
LASEVLSIQHTFASKLFVSLVMRDGKIGLLNYVLLFVLELLFPW